MNISLSTIINTNVWTSLLLLILLFVIKRPAQLLPFSMPVIIITSSLLLLRSLIPIEFPFTQNIVIREFYPSFYLFLKRDLFTIFGTTIKLFHLFAIIWTIGSIILLIKSVFAYKNLCDAVKEYETVSDERVTQILNEINCHFKHPRNFTIKKTAHTVSPYVFGIHSPTIVLPDTNLDAITLRHVIAHELHHYYRHHLIFIYFLQFCRIIYFWNPIIYILFNKFNLILEFDVDKAISRNQSYQEMQSYMESLLKISREQYSQKDSISSMTMNYSTMQASGLKQRILYLVNPPKVVWSHFHHFLYYGLIVFTISVSWLYIVEPASTPEEAATENLMLFTEENAYFIERDDGLYDLFYNGEFLTTTPEIFDPNIPIRERGNKK